MSVLQPAAILLLIAEATFVLVICASASCHGIFRALVGYLGSLWEMCVDEAALPAALLDLF